MGMKRIVVLGSTGSIGTQTLEVCRAQGFEVTGLAAYHNVELLAEQAAEFSPKAVCIYDASLEEECRRRLAHRNIEVLTGMEGLCRLAGQEEADILLNAVVGMIGLRPTLAAIRAGKDIALANKETLVTGGKLVIEEARRRGVKIYPVDSEHSAIFQSMQGSRESQVKKIILTASGGPFFGRTRAELGGVTKADALKHPNWTMGAKITVDSATLMNKGLELIEACWLFDKSPEEIEIVVHRQSIVHSLVEFDDYAVLAQLGVPDMKLPIQYALTYPERLRCPTDRLSLTQVGSFTFEKPDEDTFICLKACKEAMRKGGLYPAIVNGANEQAVEYFLQDRIGFLDIGELVYGSLSLKYEHEDFDETDIHLADSLAREYVRAKVAEKEQKR